MPTPPGQSQALCVAVIQAGRSTDSTTGTTTLGDGVQLLPRTAPAHIVEHHGDVDQVKAVKAPKLMNDVEVATSRKIAIRPTMPVSTGSPRACGLGAEAAEDRLGQDRVAAHGVDQAGGAGLRGEAGRELQQAKARNTAPEPPRICSAMALAADTDRTRGRRLRDVGDGPRRCRAPCGARHVPARVHGFLGEGGDSIEPERSIEYAAIGQNTNKEGSWRSWTCR